MKACVREGIDGDDIFHMHEARPPEGSEGLFCLEQIRWSLSQKTRDLVISKGIHFMFFESTTPHQEFEFTLEYKH
ncbi:hypothetical protein OAD26_00405 [bacterium]|nr:hypothetical protein [bacterium]